MKEKKGNYRNNVWLVKGKEDQSPSVSTAPRGPQSGSWQKELGAPLKTMSHPLLTVLIREL